jgi:subtilisin family serine protease
MQEIVRLVIARGTLVVAAVGNDGPAAPPLYPAAYPDVIAVTAVDPKHQVLPEAGRGTHVDFAAPGADVPAARAGTVDTYLRMRGTSFAAPVVAGLLAQGLVEPGREAAIARVAVLAGLAVDLGARGRDVIYGNGLVGESVRSANLQARITSN